MTRQSNGYACNVIGIRVRCWRAVAFHPRWHCLRGAMMSRRRDMRRTAMCHSSTINERVCAHVAMIPSCMHIHVALQPHAYTRSKIHAFSCYPPRPITNVCACVQPRLLPGSRYPTMPPNVWARFSSIAPSSQLDLMIEDNACKQSVDRPTLFRLVSSGFVAATCHSHRAKVLLTCG